MDQNAEIRLDALHYASKDERCVLNRAVQYSFIAPARTSHHTIQVRSPQRSIGIDVAVSDEQVRRYSNTSSFMRVLICQQICRVMRLHEGSDPGIANIFEIS